MSEIGEKSNRKDGIPEDMTMETQVLAGQLKEIVSTCSNDMCPYHYYATAIVTLTAANEVLQARISALEFIINNPTTPNKEAA